MMTPDRAALGLDTTGCASCKKRQPARYTICVQAIRTRTATPCERDAEKYTIKRRSMIAKLAYELLREGPATSAELRDRLGYERGAINKALHGMRRDGLIRVAGQNWRALVYEVAR